MHSFLLHNGEVRPCAEQVLTPGQVGLLNGWGVFSTLRVRDGVLFAFERHWARMTRDAGLLRFSLPWTPEEFERMLLKLVDANGARNATLRVAVVRNRGGMFEGPGIANDADVIAFTAELKTWGDSVRLDILPQARHASSEFAGTKILSWAQNLVMYERAQSRGFDEVILLNERDEVSECTSANVFAIFGDVVSTPPLDSGCLPGITRAVLIEEVGVPGVNYEERTLRVEDLERADSVFLTSSTRGVLPVREIEGLTIRTGSGIVPRLQQGFDEYQRRYCAARASEYEVAGYVRKMS